MASLASMASDSTASSALALSRGDRFKLAEVLSRDAAQFASRVSSLRHTKISAAGKALDKLIDDSRKPVPEELLDEQDRLEDKGINDMEDIGKFVMGVVMQWKKYVFHALPERNNCELFVIPGRMRYTQKPSKTKLPLRLCSRRSRRPNSTTRPHDRIPCFCRGLWR